MPFLSYNCLNKLNLCPMYIFKFQETWFYPADLGHPRLRYQTMSTKRNTKALQQRGKNGDAGEEFRGLKHIFLVL